MSHEQKFAEAFKAADTAVVENGLSADMRTAVGFHYYPDEVNLSDVPNSTEVKLLIDPEDHRSNREKTMLMSASTGYIGEQSIVNYKVHASEISGPNSAVAVTEITRTDMQTGEQYRHRSSDPRLAFQVGVVASGQIKRSADAK